MKSNNVKATVAPFSSVSFQIPPIPLRHRTPDKFQKQCVPTALCFLEKRPVLPSPGSSFSLVTAIPRSCEWLHVRSLQKRGITVLTDWAAEPAPLEVQPVLAYHPEQVLKLPCLTPHYGTDKLVGGTGI